MAREINQLKPAPLVSKAQAYRPPNILAPISLRLDGNEGPLPPAELLNAVTEAGIESVRHYPNPNKLEQQIAEMLCIEPERVLLTAGADDALMRVIRSMLTPEREMVLSVPTFEMFERYARLTGCKIVQIPWLEGAYPTKAVLNAVTDTTALIIVVTPNSPTGLNASAKDLEAISTNAPNTLILVDLAYNDFADEDLTKCVLALPNAVGVWSMSKAWGLAGLRVGWAAGPPRVIEWMRTVGNPYSVSSPSLNIAETHLDKGRKEVQRGTQLIRKQRTTLSDKLRKVGAEPFPSQANFVFAKHPNTKWVRDGLYGLGIAIRIFSGQPYLENGMRITLPGEKEAFTRLLFALDVVFTPEAILFDIDDTLADVTESYRRATVATAKAFGAEVTFDDITQAKAKGNANNDWELTWRLIRNRNIEVSLDEVTRCFEEYYQGTSQRAGMCETETLLVERSLLERLSTRVKLGIVTGRPRRDANAFLKKNKIAHLFGAVSTMDDGPLKPSPAPVQLALKKLGVERAWMVGDTPDDMRAARGASVLPLGVVAPADDPDVAKMALIRAGAGRILEPISAIEELLP